VLLACVPVSDGDGNGDGDNSGCGVCGDGDGNGNGGSAGPGVGEGRSGFCPSEIVRSCRLAIAVGHGKAGRTALMYSEVSISPERFHAGEACSSDNKRMSRMSKRIRRNCFFM
jgi:hypothetical protein